MLDIVRFAVDPRLASLLGDSYRSTEQAIKELVDNAWDADAEEVSITLPTEMSSEPIIIVDDGCGMTAEELKTEYLKVARDRRMVKGILTVAKKRKVRGRRGVGKFSGLMVADQMDVTTKARGQMSAITLQRSVLAGTTSDFEAVDIPFATSTCEKEDHGTTITLTALNRRLAHPNPEKLRRILILDYGRETDFRIVVNGVVATFHDIPGEAIEVEKPLPQVGDVRLSFTIANDKQAVRSPGIVVKVHGKPIGKPRFFGLDEREDVPQHLLKKLYGEVHADGLADDLTADWGAVVENSTAYHAVCEYVHDVVKEQLGTSFKKEFRNLEARIKQRLERRLSALPENRRAYAHKQIESILKRFYQEDEEKLQAIISVLLDGLERDEYWEVLQAVHRAENATVQHLAQAIVSFGLTEIVLISKQAKYRLEVLDSLDKLAARADALEKEMHEVIASNLWILGAEHSLLSSNKTNKTIIESYTDKEYAGDRASKRPDLLLLTPLRGSHLLIEFKRPNKQIDRDDDNQAQKYRDDLGDKFNPMNIWVIGKSVDKSLRVNPGTRAEYFSYSDLLSRARSELEWLLKTLAQETRRVML